MKTQTEIIRYAFCVSILILFTLVSTSSMAETDRITVEDPNTQAIKFKVTSDGNVTGASFVGSPTDGAAISIQQGPTEAASAMKFSVNDAVGAFKAGIRADGRIGVGTSTPSFSIEVKSASSPYISGTGIGLGGSVFSQRDYLGSITPTVGDNLGATLFAGSNASPSQSGTAAGIYGDVDAAGGTRIKGRLRFSTSDGTTVVERARIDSAGNFGIGTASPSQKLEVNGNVKATNFIGDGSQLTNLPGGSGGGTWGSITGTLSSQTDLQSALSTKASTSSLATVATTGSYNDLVNKPAIPALETQTSILSKIGSQADGTVLSLQQGPSEAASTVKFAVNDATGAFKTGIRADGRIGVGTSTPSFSIEVKSASSPYISGTGIGLGGSVFSQRDYLGSITPTVGDNLGATLFAGSNASPSQSGTAAGIYGDVDAAGGTRIKGRLRFSTSDGTTVVERARIDSAGNFGIGTTAPTQKFEVNGGVRLNTVTTRPSCDSTTRGTFWITQGGSDDSIQVCVMISGSLGWKTVAIQ